MPFDADVHRNLVRAGQQATKAVIASKGLNVSRGRRFIDYMISAAFYGNTSDTDPIGSEPTYYDGIDLFEYMKIIHNMVAWIRKEGTTEQHLEFTGGDENTIYQRVDNIMENGTPN